MRWRKLPLCGEQSRVGEKKRPYVQHLSAVLFSQLGQAVEGVEGNRLNRRTHMGNHDAKPNFWSKQDDFSFQLSVFIL